jgi:hypothetical protein
LFLYWRWGGLKKMRSIGFLLVDFIASIHD